MSFELTCPNCGVREVTDFASGGDVRARPSRRGLSAYSYFRRNVAEPQREWWVHRSACRTWFEVISPSEVKRLAPAMVVSEDATYPIVGALYHGSPSSPPR